MRNAALRAVGVSESCCPPGPAPRTEAERRTLTIALALNGAMFVIGLVAALIGQSAGILADALDMLTDAFTYGLSLWAIGRSARLKANTALTIGCVLLVLGAGVILESGRKAIFGSEPVGVLMMGMALLSLAVNVNVLRMLAKFRSGDVNLRASYICTRADVIANFGVLASGALVLLTGSRYPDLVVGVAIGVYVMKEAAEILGQARKARFAGSGAAA